MLEDSGLPLIIDADTGNELDDLFAIVGAVLNPAIALHGLTSAQYHSSPIAPINSVGESQRINEDILKLMDRMEIPHLLGSNYPLVNEVRPQPSPAASYIIEQAHVPRDDKLNLVILGPCTNVASAVLMDPTIVEKIRVNYLGFWHDPVQNTWSKREFNTNNDPHAVDVLLNHPAIDFQVMTATTCQHLVFQKTEVDTHLKGKGGMGDYLLNRWETYERWWQETDPEKSQWIMWDVALIEALANPQLAETGRFITPHDNREREITVFTEIDVEEMKGQYFSRISQYLRSTSDRD